MRIWIEGIQNISMDLVPKMEHLKVQNHGCLSVPTSFDSLSLRRFLATSSMFCRGDAIDRVVYKTVTFQGVALIENKTIRYFPGMANLAKSHCMSHRKGGGYPMSNTAPHAHPASKCTPGGPPRPLCAALRGAGHVDGGRYHTISHVS